LKRLHSSLNLSVFCIVPQGEKWIIEKFGKYSRTLDSGIHWLVPVFDQIAYKHLTKEIPVEISQQTAITKDNVQIMLDGVLYVRVIDTLKASYGTLKHTIYMFILVINLQQFFLQLYFCRNRQPFQGHYQFGTNNDAC